LQQPQSLTNVNHQQSLHLLCGGTDAGHVGYMTKQVSWQVDQVINILEFSRQPNDFFVQCNIHLTFG